LQDKQTGGGWPGLRIAKIEGACARQRDSDDAHVESILAESVTTENNTAGIRA